jgi:dipicolinate synthase subunit B
MTTIVEAENIGPKKLFDIMLIAPCTGNTLAKLNHGIVDTAVLMAAKSHLRNNRPLVIALSTNDALGAAAVNIGGLLNRRNIYFVPYSQDDYVKKPRSMIARFGLCEQTLNFAIEGEQIQPLVLL